MPAEQPALKRTGERRLERFSEALDAMASSRPGHRLGAGEGRGRSYAPRDDRGHREAPAPWKAEKFETIRQFDEMAGKSGKQLKDVLGAYVGMEQLLR